MNQQEAKLKVAAAQDKAREERERVFPIVTAENRKEAETFERH